jgi:hypothetical protein
MSKAALSVAAFVDIPASHVTTVLSLQIKRDLVHMLSICAFRFRIAQSLVIKRGVSLLVKSRSSE